MTLVSLKGSLKHGRLNTLYNITLKDTLSAGHLSDIHAVTLPNNDTIRIRVRWEIKEICFCRLTTCREKNVRVGVI